MKIALAGTTVGRGGIQTHFEWLATALAEEQHEVRLFSLGGNPLASDAPRDSRLRSLGIEITYVHAGASPRTAGLRLLRELKRFRPHAYLACGTGRNLFLPALLSRCCGRLIFHEVMSGVAGGWRDSRWLARWCFDTVVAQATPVAENFKLTFGSKLDIPVLPAFPEPLERTAMLPQSVHRHVARGTARAALFSRLVPHKQALWLVKQWNELQSEVAELHIYGKGPEEAPIKEFIHANRLERKIFCHGEYPGGQEYLNLLAGFDVTLLPTVGAEGAPLVLLEAMACGVPFVAFDVGGIPDYGNPDSRICSALEPESFLGAVRNLVANMESGSVDQSRLQRLYFDKFSFARLKHQWLQFFSREVLFS